LPERARNKRQTKKNHLTVVFFLAKQITAWLARKQQKQVQQRERQQMRQRQVLQRELELVQLRERQQVQELLLSYRKRPEQQQR
jgi:hypothetical protein